MEQGVDKQGCTGPGKGRHQRQQADQGPGKEHQQQESDTDSCQYQSQLHIVADDTLVIQSRPIGTHRSKGYPSSLKNYIFR